MSDYSEDRAFGGVMKAIFYIAFFGVMTFRGGCVDDSVATKAMTNMGFTNVHIVDHGTCFAGLRGCDVQDAATFTVYADNVRGEHVKMLVCTGWPFKGATVRSP